MNKIYLGETEVANAGSGGGGTIDTSGFVDVSTWDEHEKVIASALVNLKGLENHLEEFDDKIEGHVETIDSQIQTLDANKADASVVYTKNDIDISDKVVAAALASLNERVTTLETSSGGSGGSGDSFDPEYLEVELADVSARVDALEQVDYVVTNDISAFVKENDISTFITDNDISTFVTQTALDASFNALDTSIIALDASVKELASSGGGGSTSPFEYIDSKYAIINKDSLYNANAQLGQYAVILNGLNYSYNYTQATGMYSIAGGQCSKASGVYSIALGRQSEASGERSVALGDGFAIGYNSFAVGRSANAMSLYSVAIGYNSTANQKNSIAIGYSTKANQIGSVAIGYSANSSNNYEIATGYFNKSIKNNTTFGSELNTLGSIGNGYDGAQTIRHNAFEVRQSGDIYVADVSAAGEYYEKPMINLQQKIYELEARIAALESGNA